MLIEKAYAKLYGTYRDIEGGYSSEALADLTGGLPGRLDINNASIEVWEKLKFFAKVRIFIVIKVAYDITL